MIANPKWFTRRSYTGWGFTPNCWQGWVYIAVLCVLFTIIPFPAVRIALGVILVIDALDIMLHLKKDERDTIHEALAERNAAWCMILVLSVGIIYQAATRNIDPFLFAVIIAGVVAKALTNWYLRDK
jgi:hypothetical protein